jgi:acetate kinase
MRILVINNGSSSIEYELFVMPGERPLLRGEMTDLVPAADAASTGTDYDELPPGPCGSEYFTSQSAAAEKE